MEKHHRIKRDPSWDPNGCNICGKVGHQAATCPNGTVQWRERLGSDALYMWWFKPKKFVLNETDKTNAIQKKKRQENSMKELVKQAKEYAQDKDKREEAEAKKRAREAAAKAAQNAANTTQPQSASVAAPSTTGNAMSHGPWVQTTDSQGRKYYWNRATNVTSWQPPPGWPGGAQDKQ